MAVVNSLRRNLYRRDAITIGACLACDHRLSIERSNWQARMHLAGAVPIFAKLLQMNRAPAIDEGMGSFGL